MALDNELLYYLLYALVARGGRGDALFGDALPLTRGALVRSLAADAFPELWFEIPLLGEPWLDFHALTSRSDLKAGMTFSPEQTGGCPRAFEWFAAQPEKGVRQLALSWDTSRGDIEHPAIQLLVYDTPSYPALTCGFLEAAGRPDATAAYRSFVDRMPKGWFACYTGVFPGRTTPFLRVECIPSSEQQTAYANSQDLLREHLCQMGMTEPPEDLLSRCQALAKAARKIEFQFDVTPEGYAGDTFSVSLRFACPPGTDDWLCLATDGPVGELMGGLQADGIVDDRWRLLEQTSFANRVGFAGESTTLFCYPAFLKLRWRAGKFVDAKAYLVAGVMK
ncbi:MAG: hypothetical protein J6D34_06380 [Atopobiaceae bacterium]|nr:hypothetical protein [Atopobiaceae bacterium]